MKISGNNFQPPEMGQTNQANLSSRLNGKTETAQERNQRNLRELSANLKRLQVAVSPKQQAANKLAILKRRLETMQHMMRMAQFISPAQAKEMARELKSIAKEMAAAARTLVNEAGAQAPAINIAAIDTGAATGDLAATGADEAQAAQQATDAAMEGAEGSIPTETVSADVAKAENMANAAATENGADVLDKTNASHKTESNGRSASSGTSGVSDSSLRLTLEEMSRMLKQILARLKTRLTDEEGQKEARAVEKELSNMEQALMQSVAAYNTQGAPVSVEIPAVNVDVKA